MKKSIVRALSVSALSAASLFAMAGCGVKGAVYEQGTPVKVGLICLHDNESTYDKNFIDALNVAVANLGDRVEFNEAWVKTGIGENQDCYDAAKELVKEGCNVIFADSFGHQDYMRDAAKEWPTVTFCHATGTNAKTADLANYHNAFASIYEGRFIAGLAAGVRLALDASYSPSHEFTDTKVGYVGAYPYAEVKSGYTSWFLGVKEGVRFAYGSAAAEKVTMDVQFTNDWYAPDAEAAAADSLIKAGAKLISQHADSMGAPSTCAKAGIPNVTYNVKTTQYDTYLAYSRINWAPYYEEVVNSLYEGRAINGETNHNWTGTLATGSVEFDINYDAVLKSVPAGQKDETKGYFEMALYGTTEHPENGIINQIKAGTYKVFDTDSFKLDAEVAEKAGAKLDDNGHVTSYLADTDGDFAGDTEVIVAKTDTTPAYFNESYFCSAPYFDLDIKGINLPAAQ